MKGHPTILLAQPELLSRLLSRWDMHEDLPWWVHLASLFLFLWNQFSIGTESVAEAKARDEILRVAIQGKECVEHSSLFQAGIHQCHKEVLLKHLVRKLLHGSCGQWSLQEASGPFCSTGCKANFKLQEVWMARWDLWHLIEELQHLCIFQNVSEGIVDDKIVHLALQDFFAQGGEPLGCELVLGSAGNEPAANQQLTLQERVVRPRLGVWAIKNKEEIWPVSLLLCLTCLAALLCLQAFQPRHDGGRAKECGINPNATELLQNSQSQKIGSLCSRKLPKSFPLTQLWDQFRDICRWDLPHLEFWICDLPALGASLAQSRSMLPSLFPVSPNDPGHHGHHGHHWLFGLFGLFGLVAVACFTTASGLRGLRLCGLRRLCGRLGTSGTSGQDDGHDHQDNGHAQQGREEAVRSKDTKDSTHQERHSASAEGRGNGKHRRVNGIQTGGSPFLSHADDHWVGRPGSKGNTSNSDKDCWNFLWPNCRRYAADSGKCCSNNHDRWGFGPEDLAEQRCEDQTAHCKEDPKYQWRKNSQRSQTPSVSWL